MKKNQLLILSAVILFVLSVIMVIISIQSKILPPGITGVGFIFIALVFLKLRD